MTAVETAKAVVRSPAAKWMAIPLLAGGVAAYETAGPPTSSPTIAVVKSARSAPTGTRKPMVRVVLHVTSAKQLSRGTILEGEGGPMIFATPAVAPTPETLLGQTVTVIGYRGSYRGKQQVSAKSIQIGGAE